MAMFKLTLTRTQHAIVSSALSDYILNLNELLHDNENEPSEGLAAQIKSDIINARQILNLIHPKNRLPAKQRTNITYDANKPFTW